MRYKAVGEWGSKARKEEGRGKRRHNDKAAVAESANDGPALRVGAVEKDAPPVSTSPLTFNPFAKEMANLLEWEDCFVD